MAADHIMATDYIYDDCTCTRVIDGDTIDVDIRKEYDLGFKMVVEGRTSQRLRLYGIDTPELRPRHGTEEEREAEKVAAKKAKVHVQELVEGKIVRIQTYKSDAFGRYLADVWVETDVGEIHLNQDLLDRGLAEVYKK